MDNPVETSDAKHNNKRLWDDARRRFGEDWQRTVLQSEIEWIWETDADLKFTWFSQGVEDVTGASSANLLGKSRIELFNEKHLEDPRTRAHVEDLKAHRPFRDFFYEFRRPEGGTRWLSVSGTPRFDADGNFTGYVGTGRDVTNMVEWHADLERLKGELDGARDLLYTMCENLSIGLVVYDPQDRLVLANEKTREMFAGISHVLEPGTSRRTILEASYDSNQYQIDKAKYSREDWVNEQLAEAGTADDRETRLTDGRWLHLQDSRLPNGYFVGVRNDITQIKGREEALLAADSQNSLLREMLDRLDVAIYAKDHNHRLVYANDGWSALSGVSPEDAYGKTDVEVYGEQGEALMESDILVLRDGGQSVNEEKAVDPSGKPIHLLSRKQKFVSSEGKSYVIGSTMDITDLKQTQQDVVSIIDALSMAVVLIDDQANCLMINSAFHKIWNTKPEDFKPNCPFRDLMDINRQNGIYDIEDGQWESYVENRVAEMRRGSVEPREFVRKDGKTLIYSVRELSNGKRMVSYFDVSELKDKEKALSEAVERNRLAEEILDSLDQGILVKDADLRVVFANQRFASTMGHDRSECIGRTAREFFPPEQALPMEESERKALVTGETIEMEEDYVDHAGDNRARLIHKSRVTTGSGQNYVAVTLTDITEIRNRERALSEAERKAQLSDRAKSEFLANMSHEIRTPMNGVLGMAELLAKSELDSKQRTFTDIIVKSGNALLTIINDILDFSKIDAGQLVLDPAPFNLRESVEDVATLVSTRAKEKDLELIARIAPDLPHSFIGDAGRFRQIITNLMGNAVKFTEQGHVLVDISGVQSPEGWKLMCRIVDTGIGIPDDKLQAVFEKFSQVDTSATRRHEGTGLGLAITSKLVELMNGKIGVKSKLGEGSEFWFEIILPEDTDTKAKPRRIPVDVSGSRILIIDDNPVNRNILMEQMTSWNFDSCAVESGELGIRMLKEAKAAGCPADLVVLDYQMPGMTGADVMRVIRSTPEIADTPVVLLTSVDQALSPDSLRDLNVDHHLLKPARSSQLLECIVEGIQSRHAPVEEPEPEVAAEPELTPEEQRMRAWISGASRTKEAQSATGQAPAPAPAPQTAPAQTAPVQAAPVQAAPAPAQPAFASMREEKAPQPAPHAIQEPAAAPAQVAPSGTGGVDVLVAEDNEVNQLVYTQIFAQLPWSYKIVGNGKLAVAAARDLAPKLVLMDVSMPVMNGLEATVAIREAGMTDLPIIGVTAHALKGDRERCMEAGMNDYLPKPISPDRLEAKIRDWLKQAEAAKTA